MLLTSVLWLLFQLHSVQTYTAKKAAAYYSKQLNTKVDIQSVRIQFWDKVTLTNFFIEDLDQDTLASLDELVIDIGFFSFDGKKVETDLNLIGGKVNLIKKEASKDYNYQFLIDYFSSNETTGNKFLWDVSVNKLALTNSFFSFHDYNYNEKPEFLDFFHLDVKNADFIANNLGESGDTLIFYVEKLKLIESNGFNLKELKGNVKLANGYIQVKGLTLETDKSSVYGSVKFEGDSFANYSDFISKVNIEANLDASLLDMRDLVYFVPQLSGLETKVYLDGDVRGKINNLKGDNVEIILNRKTFLRGDFAFRGLPDFANTFIFLELTDFRTTAQSLRELPFPPFGNNNTLKVPAYFDELGTINFDGNFTGYLTDFVAYGNFSTQLGDLKTDIQLKEDISGELIYNGKVESKSFELGQFLKVKDLGKISMSATLTGRGLTKDVAKAKAIGDIKSIAYRGYNYKNIKVNGAIDNETFSGLIDVNNEDIQANFSGTINTNKKTPISNFNLDVKKANLAKLNLFNQKDTLTSIRFKSIIDLRGNDVDNFLGTAIFDSISYVDSKLNHKINTVAFEASRNGIQREIDLKSSILNANLRGEFQFRSLKEVLKAYANQYVPNTKYEFDDFGIQKFELTANFKNTSSITEILLPELAVDSGTDLRASLNSTEFNSKIKLKGNGIQYKDIRIKEPDLDLGTRNGLVSANFYSSNFAVSKTQSFTDFWLTSSLQDTTNHNIIKWKSFGSQIGEGRLNIDNEVSSLRRMDFKLENSYFVLKDEVWNIENGNTIELDSTVLLFSSLIIGNQNQQLKVDGTASTSKNDTLNVNLKDIDLSFISTLLPKNSLAMNGIANGNSKLVGVYENISLTTGLQLDSLEVNDVFIGTSNLKSIWNSEKEALIIDGNLGDNNSDILKIFGEVRPLEEENSLDLKLVFNKFPLPLVKPYLVDYLSEMEGVLNGIINITGRSDKPQLKGELDLEKAFVHFNYLNTDYTIDDKIIIEPDFIGFDLIKVKDNQGSHAVATGTIFHENYSNFNYDIGLEFKNFLSLDTDANDNDLYFGKGITSGTGNISGYDNQLIIELDLKTERGTDFKIPLTEGIDISNSDFIIFTNSPNYSETLKKEVDLSGIQMKFDLEITPEAKVQIIFDEQVGDVIKANGEGELKLEINTIGDFNIYGQYVVEKGEYLFTLKNIINKRFEIANGSSIYWDGSPYQAVLDMQAIYKLRAPLYDLFPEDSTSGFKRRTPVELELQLSEYLLTPEISFDIRLPSADENTKRRLESILYVNNNDVNPQEMNQQVFGLLVLNRFLPSASSTGSADSYNRGTPGLNNGFEFVSNQLSNWASRLSDQFDVGVKYSPADDLNSDEVDLSLSTEIFNDRLILDGNLGYSGDSPQYDSQYSGFIGEFTAEYKISRDGRYRVKGFNRSVSNSLLQLNSPYTQGVGLFYREEFDKVEELWKKYFGKKK